MQKIKLSLLIISSSALLLSAEDAPSIEDIQALQALKLEEEVVKEQAVFREIQTSTEKPEDELECEECIYGFDMFRSTPTTFALSSNVPVPTDYNLGPGDKIKVEFFGNSNEKREAYISRTGIFNLPLLGPINLAGISFTKAQELLSNKVEKELIGTEVYLSQVR